MDKIGEGYFKKRKNQLKCNVIFFKKSAAGEVYVTMDTRTSKKVAVKKMALKGQNVKVLVNEIAVMKDSTHPNIVQYFDSYLVGGELWVCIPYYNNRNHFFFFSSFRSQ